MTRLGLVVAWALGHLAAGAAASAAPPLPRVPEGFTIEVAAEHPVVERPVMACFDERGRLFVVDSAGVNEPFEKLLQNPPHRITVLEDTDSDGRFDRRTLFADKLVMPQGVLPSQGAVYTASPPSVWKLEDTDGDGLCDRRTAIVSEFGSNGNAADIHGPFLGPDGWLYLCDGRHGHKVTLDDGTIDQGLAGGIFRFRTDGTGFERVCGGGFDNPVEIDFTDAGEILGTVNILHNSPRQDCLMHWVEGGVYPHADQEQCIAEYKRTGDLLTEVKAFGHVAVSGMTRYRSDVFGPEYRDNLFITFFNRHKLVRSIVERSGATFTSREEDFLVSDEKDFHPTDVLEDADGSLLVIDTGGWFRIGCPVSEIAKPDVLGRIYRVRRQDAAGAGPADYASITSVAAVSGPPRSAESRRIAQARADGMAVPRRAGAVRSHARLSALQKMVVDETPAVRREAANTLGRIAAAMDQKANRSDIEQSVAALCESIRLGVTDRVLEHSLIYALIRIDDRAATIPFLKDPNPQVRRAALIALDQMDHGELTRELAAPLLDTDDPALRKTTLAVIASRPGWATELVALLREWLEDRAPPEERLTLLRGVLVAQAADAEVQRLVAEALAADSTVPATRLLLWEVLDRAPLAELPEAWTGQIGRALRRAKGVELSQVLAVILSRGLTAFDAELLALAGDARREPSARIDALAAAAPRLAALDEPFFELLLGELRPDAAPLAQLAAARGLGDAPLSDSQLRRLAARLPAAGPLAAPALLRAFGRSSDAVVGLALVAALAQSGVAENLATDELAAVVRKYPSSVQKEAGPLLARLGGGGLEEQRARLAELAALLNPAGDPDKGKGVFFGKKAACANCHTVGGEGGRVGPDLTKIGASRSGIDLLEAVVFPSATFARDFRPYVVATDAGKTYTGVVSRQTPDAIHLRTADLAEVRIPRAAIEDLRESSTSIMPKGLDATLTAEELRDLMAYLAALK